jgi:hypothetical protein
MENPSPLPAWRRTASTAPASPDYSLAAGASPGSCNGCMNRTLVDIVFCVDNGEPAKVYRDRNCRQRTGMAASSLNWRVSMPWSSNGAAARA